MKKFIKNFDGISRVDEVYYLYWIRHNGSSIDSEGYIGVTSDPQVRCWYHENDFNNGVGRVFENADPASEIFFDVIDMGCEKDMLKKEMLLRPQRSVGWNLAVGGINKYSSEVFQILGEVFENEKVSSILTGHDRLVRVRNVVMPYYDLPAKVSKSLKFKEPTKGDVVYVNGIAYSGKGFSIKSISEILDSHTSGIDVTKISRSLGLSRTVVERVLKAFNYEIPNKVVFCYKDVWFDSTGVGLKPYDCWCCLGTAYRTGDVELASIVYGISKKRISNWLKIIGKLVEVV